MGLVGKREIRCPVCDVSFGRTPNVALHNLTHALPAADGGEGYGWQCGCGQSDGVWETKAAAAAGLTLHFQQRHGIAPM